MKKLIVLLACVFISSGAFAEFTIMPRGNPFKNVDEYGRYVAVQDSSVWYREIFVTPSSVRVNPTISKPDVVWWGTVGYTYSFDAADAESIYFHVEIPHDYKLGTPLGAHVHWSPSTTNTGNCAWKISWEVTDVNGTIAFAAGDTLSARQAGSGTAYKHQLLDLGDIPMTAITGVSSILNGVLIRDAEKTSDSFTGEALFQDLGFHYQADAWGSRWEFIK